MRYVDNFPQRIKCIETVWIPMSDGCRLAARLWIPEDAEQHPVPAVIEYEPYRRRDHARTGDSRNLPYIAGHGYACLRIDIRGSGDSDGILEDEYLELEQDDGLEVLSWIAAQPWCDGSVGIMGISWGGFSGLQIAARHPPELKAVISVCSTDDRYADDVHHMGGCLLGDNLSWASVMFAFNAQPPDPEIVGEAWRDMWMERLQNNEPWLEKWLRHQRRDAYWQHGSICEDYSAIEVPVLLAGGWADGYSNAIFRMLANLNVPRWAMIGPWSHSYPHMGTPGPAVGFLQEVVRFWDHWLKGIDRGVEQDPMLRVWMQDSVPPHPTYKVRPGRWVAEQEWPSPRIESRIYTLDSSGLVEGDKPVPETAFSIQSPLSVGLFAGKWCSYAAPPDLPYDQREEDGGALVFETAPLKEPLEILGPPVVDLDLSVDRPVAMIALRLSDVAPNGEATRITYSLMNLTHLEGHSRPQLLVAGERYTIQIKLNDIAQYFPSGHYLRLSLSTSYFPLAWPAPERATLTVYTGASRLTLPVRPPRAEDEALRSLGEAECAPPTPTSVIRTEDHRWTVIRDLARDLSTLEVVIDDGVLRFAETGLEVGTAATERYSYRRGDYGSVRGEVRSTWTLRRKDWSVRTETSTVLTSDTHSFRILATLDAYEGEQRVFSRNWDHRIPRDHV
ncbi:MAG: CocE/NonD family hydrolase [Gammaproteobacteria bacterium]